MKRVEVGDRLRQAKVPHHPKYDRRDGQSGEVNAVLDRLHSRHSVAERYLYCAPYMPRSGQALTLHEPQARGLTRRHFFEIAPAKRLRVARAIATGIITRQPETAL